MRHLQSGRKLGVDSPHRDAMLRSLTLALIEHDHIRTTRARAKELRRVADRIVTWGKRGDVHARRLMVKFLGSTQTGPGGVNRARKAIERVYSELVPRFKTRPGGYTQILHLAARRAGDNAEMVLMRYLPAPDEKGAKGKGDKKTAKAGDKEAKAPKKADKKVEAAASDKAKAKKAPAEDKGPQDKPAKAKKSDKE